MISLSERLAPILVEIIGQADLSPEVRDRLRKAILDYAALERQKGRESGYSEGYLRGYEIGWNTRDLGHKKLVD